MANLKDIKRRIGSVEKTQQITSAMRMVAAAKLRRAEAAIRAARPYAERMKRTIGELAAAGGVDGRIAGMSWSPLCAAMAWTCPES